MANILTLRYAAEMLGAHPKTVQKWLRLGKLPGTKAPGGWRIVEDDLFRFLAGPFASGQHDAERTLGGSGPSPGA